MWHVTTIKSIYSRKRTHKTLTIHPSVLKQVLSGAGAIDYYSSSILEEDEFLDDDVANGDLLYSLHECAVHSSVTQDAVFLNPMYESLYSEVIPIMDPQLWNVMSHIHFRNNFNPGNVTPVKEKEKIDHNPGGVYSHPALNSAIPQMLLNLEATRGHTTPTPYSLSYLKTLHGVSISHTTGLEKAPYYKAVSKMSNNIVCPREEVSKEMLMAFDMDCKKWWPFKDQIELDLGSDRIRTFFEGKNTSLGYIPARFYYYEHGIKKYYRTVSKSDGVEAIIFLYEYYLETVKDYLEGGPPPLNIFIEVEANKHEILRWINALHIDLNKQNETFVSKCMEKLRLFYMSCGLSYAIDRAIYEPISNMCRYYQSGIGIKPEGGGFQALWRLMDCHQDAPFHDAQRRVIDKWAERGVFLHIYQTGQGDFSSYDQTLLACLLAFCVAIVCYIYKPSDSVPAPLLRYLLTHFITTMVHKIMYVYALDQHVSVWGDMFSGKYATSSGDSRYQMFLFAMYIRRLYQKYPDYRELIYDISSSFLIFVIVYGDDHLYKWPVVMNKFTLYKDSPNFMMDFVNFTIRVFGMIYKESAYDIFPILYSEHHFFTNEQGIVLEDKTLAVEGPEFLQNQVSRIFLDGDYLGDFPFRSTESIYSRMGLSISATGSPKDAMMLWASLARLCAGNLEAYFTLEKLYFEARSLFGALSIQDWEAFVDRRESHAVYLYLKGASPEELLSFPNLLDLQLAQEEGCNDGSAFAPLTPSGNVDHEAKSRLYAPMSELMVKFVPLGDSTGMYFPNT